MNKKLKSAFKNGDDINKILGDAWLNIDVDESELYNPLDIPTELREEPELYISWLLTKPEYFSFVCSELLGISIIPTQAVMLEEMWKRKFPMLIASRGFGKLIKSDELIRVKNGWTKIKDIHVGDKVYGSDGKLTNVISKTHKQTDVNMYRITLRDGRSIDCCEDHMWKVWDKNKNKKGDIVWSELKTKDMVKNYKYSRSGEKNNGFECRYALPINKCLTEETERDLLIHPYVVGVLLGDGGITTKSIVITSLDKELIDRVESLLPDGYFIKQYDSKTFKINRKDKSFPVFYKLLEKIGIHGHNSHTKFIPEEYQYASSNQRLELIKGLMDTDGWAKKSVIEYYTVSNRLSNDFLNVARSIGLHCKHSLKESWLNGKRYADCNRISIYTNKEIFSLSRKLNSYINHTVSKQGASKYEKVFITNIEYIGKGEGYCITVDNPDHTYITKDYIVTHNSFSLALYGILRALLLKDRKIVICGAAFRQSKVIFEYMDTIYNNSPILRDIIGSNGGPRRGVDMCRFLIHGSTVNALPIGDGQKIRGQRANDIIADEFACLDKDTLVETSHGLIRVNDFDNGYHIITGDKTERIENPAKYIRTPKVDVYEITFQNGYTIKSSEIHKLNTNKGWKTVTQLKSGDYVERSNKQMIFGNYPISISDAWLMGILVSEGSINNKKRISITTTDESLMTKLVNKYNFKFNTVQPYIDDRGWNCKKSYKLYKDDEQLRTKLFDMGLDYTTAHNKKIPSSVLMSSKETIQAFLNGLFDGDGSAFLWKDRDINNNLGLAYYSVSERLCRDVQILMYKLGYDGYINKRKSKISDNDQWFVRWNNNTAIKACEFLHVDRFADVVNNCYERSEPTYICKYKNKYKVQMKYCGKQIQKTFKEKNDANKFVRAQLSKTQYQKVIKIEKLNYTDHLYDYYLPKTNSFYADGFRNHNSISRDIFENVIAGFAAVSSDPIANVKKRAFYKMALQLAEEGVQEAVDILNKKKQDIDLNMKKDNQIIISGTAYYDFNHFGEYWRKWKKFIQSKGDPEKLGEIFKNDENTDGEIPEDFDWRDYSIIRIPFEMIPKGFMDEAQVARSKATIHSGIYQMEFGACFANDSNGFYKRSLIESCVVSDQKSISWGDEDNVTFEACTHGNPHSKFIYGIDPASEVDNFSIVIMEIRSDHRRVVYVWTTNRKQHQEELEAKLVKENDFYSYCARKIRDLMVKFPTDHISIDSQGGGIAVMEALHDEDKLARNDNGDLIEAPIYPRIDPEKRGPYDMRAGLHILEMVNFASADWTSEANHGLRKDMEDKIILFPVFDPIVLAKASFRDGEMGLKYDTLEDCIMEIEKLKDELSQIMISQTASGRDKWDTPEVKLPGGKKGRLRKDRYSSLTMANMAARYYHRNPTGAPYEMGGGFAGRTKKTEGALYTNPWYNEAAQDYFDALG